MTTFGEIRAVPPDQAYDLVMRYVDYEANDRFTDRMLRYNCDGRELSTNATVDILLINAPATDLVYQSARMVILGPDVRTISSETFAENSSLQQVMIPDTVTEIEDEAFRDCSQLQEVTIPSTVTEIWCETFANCSNLERVVLSNETTKIHNNAFFMCEKLAHINMPETVTEIGDRAFYGCRSLTQITIPYDIVEIGECAFRLCTELHVTLPATDFNCGACAFIDSEIQFMPARQ